MVCNKNTRKCHTHRDDGYNSCTAYEDRGYNSCKSWNRWFRWLCISWTWVSSFVCSAYFWVANIVCSGWVIVVEYYICGGVNMVTNFFCNAFSTTGTYSNFKVDFVIAYNTVRMARWVYDGLPAIKNNLGDKLEFGHSSSIEDGVMDAQSVVCSFEETIYVALRGTEGVVKDIITDISAYPSSYYSDGFCGSKVHIGFLDAYLSIEGRIEQAVRNLIAMHPKSPLIVTGHSMGGAMAVICALDLQKKFPDKRVIMYNYGAPSVGNSDFIDMYNACVNTSWQFRAESDIVPTLSPYAHVKEQFVLKTTAPWFSFTDHSRAGYENEILKLLKGSPFIISGPNASVSSEEVSIIPDPGPLEPSNIMIGNTSEKEIHFPHCAFVRLIASDHKFEVNAADVQAYYNSGYDGCFFCNRQKHWK